MPENESQEQAGTVTNYKYVRASDFRSVYSNNAHFYSHLFDFSIFFGEVVRVEQVDENTGNVTVEDKIKIVMNPLQAKIFITVAQLQLKAFEERFGEINLPVKFMETRNTTESEESDPREKRPAESVPPDQA